MREADGVFLAWNMRSIELETLESIYLGVTASYAARS
jgi:hypothetical protein